MSNVTNLHILNDVKIYLISIVYETRPDPLHHFSGQPLSTSFLPHFEQGQRSKKKSLSLSVNEP